MNRSRSAAVGLLMLVSLSHAMTSMGSEHAPGAESTMIHHPSASLAIAGKLEDVKMKSSIAQLVRTLQHPHQPPSEFERRPKLELVTKQGVVKAPTPNPNGRKLVYTEESAAGLPQSITISSQAIRIGTGNNRTGAKRSLNLDVDQDGVRTIEGVRVPDDEHDKHYTWRNARVIKGFLVPNGEEANPHRKRQVVHHVSDPQAYLAAAAQAQAQGVTATLAQQQPVPPQTTYSSSGQQPTFAYAPQQGQQMYVFQDPNQSQSASQRSETSSNSQQQQFLIAQQAQAAVQALQQQQQQQTQPSQITQADILNAVLGGAGASSYVQIPSQEIDQRQLLQQQQQQYQQQQQLQAQAAFEERQGQVVQSAPQNAFVVQPQTYVAGPGGQTFTVPIPVPADQVQHYQQQQQHTHHHQQQQVQQHHHQAQRLPQRSPHFNHKQQQQQQHPNNNNFARRVMTALHNNQKTLERMDTATAVVPALASTGIFLGLSALAAGWYLSKNNREVGIVKRTGKPSTRNKRDVPPGFPGAPQPQGNGQEVDQATFFQSIIQQSLEKSQQQYEEQEPIVYQPQQQQQPEPVYQQQEERRPQAKSGRRPASSRRDDEEPSYPNRKYAQEKSGALTIGSSKNFAKVFIPAFILGISVISITALIFGWYVTGANREIAFLEPASYSRKKRSLDLSDGWLQRAIKAIHGNPYDRLPAPTSKSLLPHPFLESEAAKTTSTEFAISNTGLTGVLAGGAIIALITLGLASSYSESARKSSLRANPSFGHFRHPAAMRGSRSLWNNDLLEEDFQVNPGLFASLLASMEGAGRKVGEAGDSPCVKRALCDLLITQDDETLKSLEKRMATLIPL
jgi:hypothetical protein